MAVYVVIVDADLSAAMVTGAVVKRIVPDAIVEHEPILNLEQLRRLAVKPDVLIIDPAAHTFRALYLLSQCIADLPTTRIAILASAPTPSLRTAAQNLGIAAYLDKPATLAKLVDMLRGVLIVDHDETPALILAALRQRS